MTAVFESVQVVVALSAAGAGLTAFVTWYQARRERARGELSLTLRDASWGEVPLRVSGMPDLRPADGLAHYVRNGETGTAERSSQLVSLDQVADLAFRLKQDGAAAVYIFEDDEGLVMQQVADFPRGAVVLRNVRGYQLLLPEVLESRVEVKTAMHTVFDSSGRGPQRGT